MRLAFCFMSNNNSNLMHLYYHFNYSVAAPPYIIDSYTVNVLINPPLSYRNVKMDRWNVKWKIYNSFAHTDYFSIRQDSLEMAGNAELIFVGDDDFKFNEGSSETINECCLYMERNPDCGAILLGANFGKEGLDHGDEIYITNNGHLNTNRGIILRCKDRSRLMNDGFHALGAMEDSVISFTCLLDGYYIARRLHVPIEHIVERNTLSYDHDNADYNLKYLKAKGIWSKINKLIGPWKDQNIWPKGIWPYYRQMAMLNGFIPKYDVDGSLM